MGARNILVNASFAPSLVAFRGPLLKYMVDAGHTVHASAPDMTSDISRALYDIGVVPHEVRMSRTGLNPAADIAYRRALRGIIKQHEIDLVMGYTIKPCIWGSLAAHYQGVESASLVTGLGYSFMTGGGMRQAGVRALTRLLWRRAAGANRVVIFQNPDDRDDFIAAGALADPQKARLVDGSGVDMAHYRRAPIPPDARFLMVARLLGNKGVREYAEAALRLIREGVAANFALAGYFDEGSDGVSPADLRRWQDGGLTYLGPLADVRPALADCSIYVLPSYREGTPRSVLEAMATGRGVITTDAPGCRETVVDGVSGILVTPRHVDELAAAMSRLSSSAELRERMGDAAWKRCSEVFAVERVNQVMFEHLGLEVVREQV